MQDSIFCTGMVRLKLPATKDTRLAGMLRNWPQTACWFDPVACKNQGDLSITTYLAGKYTATSPTGLQDWVLTFRK